MLRPPATLGLVAVICAFTVALPRAHADGTERPTVVIDVSDETKPNAEIAREVARALRKHPGYPVKDIHALLNAGGEVEEQNNIKTGQAFHQAGVAALAAGDAEDAAEQLESAATLLEASFAFLRNVEEYRQLLLRLGVARHSQDDEAGAREAFSRAMLFRAEPTSVPLGEAQALYDGAAADLAAKELGAIVIATEPPHAEVYVNGRYRGISPATVAALPIGTHLVAIFKPGWARRTATVTSSSTTLSAHTLALDPARRQLPFDQLRQDLVGEIAALSDTHKEGGDGVRAAGALLFSEVAIVVRSTGDRDAKRVELFAFDTRSRRLLNRAAAQVDWRSRNKEAIAALITDLLDFDYAVSLGGAAADPGATPPAAEEEDSVVTKWWFWTIVGVGVAGVAAGTAAAVVLSDEGAAPPTTGSMAIQF